MSKSTSNVEFDLYQLKKLGRDGKLFTIEVVYNVTDWNIPENSTRIYRSRNMTSQQMRQMRVDIWQVGIAIHVDTGHWKVISPKNIVDFDIYQQSGYFDEENGRYSE
jgi:hypothetical protein